MAGSPRQEMALLFEYDPQSDRWVWSEGMRDLFGLPSDQAPSTEFLLGRMLEPDRTQLRDRFEQHLGTPGSFSCAFRMSDGRGRARQVRYVAHGEAGGVEVKRVYGFVIDVTEVWGDYAAEAVAGAFEHRAGIEQAKGALMLSFGIDDAAAFELLRGYSNRANLKLSVVAERITAGLSDARFAREDPVRSLLDIVTDLEDHET